MGHRSGHNFNFMPMGNSPLFFNFGMIRQDSNHILTLTRTCRTAWEIHGKRTDEVGAFMAEFAISSIATMATKNLQVQIEGTVPYLGSRVKVYWPYVFALFACIAGVHLALLASAIYASRLVVIKADSNLSTARLLRPLVDKLGSSGTILNGEEVSRAIQEIDGCDVVYGPRDVEGSNDYYLDIGDNVSPRARLTNRRHPDGTYL
jgi:hypothetical protein